MNMAPAGAEHLLTLVLSTGDRRTFTVERRRLVVGRGADCDISIEPMTVSRAHAELLPVDADAWLVRDLASTNGVVVNGILSPEATVRPGDEVTLGDARLYIGAAPCDLSTIEVMPRSGGWWLDPDTRTLRLNGQVVGQRLSPFQYKLLLTLVRARGRLVDSEALCAALWGDCDDDALHQLVRQTRRRIGDDARAPRVIVNVPGAGYRIAVDDAPGG